MKKIKRCSRRNLKNIQMIIENKTGVHIAAGKNPAGYRARQMALLAGCLLCFVTLSAFAYAKFSGLDGDEAGFGAAYQGDGRFEIVVMNYSDRELKLQNDVKVMQWSTGKEVEGNGEKIRMESLAIAPRSQGIVLIDLSEGYDIGAMEENLQEGDWYYFVLTNNNFAFGQDWMCSFDFGQERTEDIESSLAKAGERYREEQSTTAPQYGTGDLAFPDWTWPTASRAVSAFYGEQKNGAFSDHINIAGTAGDEVYAVADGTVIETAFESTYGNIIIVDLGEGVTVKYGHLKDTKVSEGDEVKQGQVIAALGQSGMAAGPNLSFAVAVDGEAVNPLGEE